MRGEAEQKGRNWNEEGTIRFFVLFLKSQVNYVKNLIISAAKLLLFFNICKFFA